MKLNPSQILSLLASLRLCSLAWAQTPIPPSTFGGETSTGPASSNTSSSGHGTPTITADFPSLSGYSSCVTGCLAMGSAAANCTSVVDISCFCVSQGFTREIVNCISAGCPQELATAESLAQQFCNVANNTTSLSFPTPTFSSTTGSLSASTSHGNFTNTAPTSTTPGIPTTLSQGPSSSNAATRTLNRGFEIGAFFYTNVGLLGMVLCACLIN